MLLIVDVNVIFSALYSKDAAYDVFAINRSRRIFEWVAPEYMFLELRKNTDKLLQASKLSRDEIENVLSFIEEELWIIPGDEFGEFVPKAAELLSEHKKDTPYLALALKLNCPIFSGDKKFKKLSPVRVYNPRELLDILLGRATPL